MLTDPPVFYEISTGAVFAGFVEVCIGFDTAGMTAEQAAQQSLFHYKDGSWRNITTTQSPGRVCGMTDSFSLFAVGDAWQFQGFLQPVDNGGTFNLMKAGAAVPVKFGLGGARGLGILAQGSPSSAPIACSSAYAPDDIELTLTAVSSSLSYDQSSGTYSYVWKSQKAWAGSCRQFTLTLTDGSVHRAHLDFRK